jgi:hypothetical protein
VQFRRVHGITVYRRRGERNRRPARPTERGSGVGKARGKNRLGSAGAPPRQFS